mgnify:CR=1 FL=1
MMSKESARLLADVLDEPGCAVRYEMLCREYGKAAVKQALKECGSLRAGRVTAGTAELLAAYAGDGSAWA